LKKPISVKLLITFSRILRIATDYCKNANFIKVDIRKTYLSELTQIHKSGWENPTPTDISV
ncbi:MAG: hypothetical protein ACKOPK_16810, partial [Dolichospermum sp.]